MSVKSWPWDVLDLPKAPATTAEVRRSYAKKLKTIDQATDIAGFEALRKAYEAALHRVEQKVRKAAEKAQPVVASPVLDALPETAPLPGPVAATPITTSATPEPPADQDPDPLPLQSPRDRLQIRLNLLQEKNILLSPQARVQAILDDPDFQTPDLIPQLRFGLAQYIRSQMLENHLGEPYLRHPGVTTDLVRALDARFGWLSDYSAFRRDFWGDERILEAMVDAAGMDRTPKNMIRSAQTGSQNKGGFLFALGLFGFVFLTREVTEASQGAEPGSGLAILSNLLLGIVAAGVYGLGLFMLYTFVAINSSRRVAIPACIWAAIGLPLLFLANGWPPGLPEIVWPLQVWFWLSLGLAIAGLAMLLHNAIGRRAHKSEKD